MKEGKFALMKLAAPTAESTKRLRWSGTSIAVLVAIFNFSIGYFRCFIFPNIPFLPWGDASGFLNNGARIVAGRLPYRDYFAFVPPGMELTYALLIREFGARSWIPNLVMAGLAAAIAALMTLAAARFLRGPIIALPALLLAAFVLPGSLDATHHWFSTVAVMGAMLVLLYRETFPAITAVGILCGIAALIRRTRERQPWPALSRISLGSDGEQALPHVTPGGDACCCWALVRLSFLPVTPISFALPVLPDGSIALWCSRSATTPRFT